MSPYRGLNLFEGSVNLRPPCAVLPVASCQEDAEDFRSPEDALVPLALTDLQDPQIDELSDQIVRSRIRQTHRTLNHLRSEGRVCYRKIDKFERLRRTQLRDADGLLQTPLDVRQRQHELSGRTH